MGRSSEGVLDMDRVVVVVVMMGVA